MLGKLKNNLRDHDDLKTGTAVIPLLSLVSVTCHFSVHLFKYVSHVMLFLELEKQEEEDFGKRSRQKQLPSLECNICVSFLGVTTQQDVEALPELPLLLFCLKTHLSINQVSTQGRAVWRHWSGLLS